MAEGNTSRTPVNKDAGARVINKSGTLQMDERAAGRRVRRDISGRPMGRRDRRGRGRRDRDLTPKAVIATSLLRSSRKSPSPLTAFLAPLKVAVACVSRLWSLSATIRIK